MKKERVITYLFIVLLLGVFLLLFYFLDLKLTGFSIYEQSNQSDFDEGIYDNTEYNGSSVVLSGENLSGTYTSKIFDADSLSQWNEISWNGFYPDVKFLFVVDGAGDVYLSTDSGLTWTQKADNYGRTTDTVDIFSDDTNLYIITKTNKEIYKSADDGVTWDIINEKVSGSNLLFMEKDSDNNFYIPTGAGVVYKSTNEGVNWTEQGDFNGAATNDAKGIAIDSSNNIFIVDGSGSVYKSTNSGVNWTKQTSAYGGGTLTDDMIVDSEGNLYILLNKKIYKSTNEGVNWSIINDSFTSYINEGLEMLIDDDVFFIADGVGRIFKSTDFGISWAELGDFNAGATNDAKGLTSFAKPTSLTFQARNCSVSDCSDAEFVNIDNLNLSGKYFQYKVLFSSPDSSETPFLTSITFNTIVNEVVNETVNAIAESTTTSSSSGGGGGSSLSITQIITSEQISEGYTKELNENEEIKFRTENNEEHSISLNSISEDKVTITVQSERVILTLGIGESKKLNLSSANYYDLYVKLENIVNGKAKVTIQTIHEEIPEQSLTTGENTEIKEVKEAPVTGGVSGITGAITGFIKSGGWAVLIFIILIIAFFVHLKKRKRASKKTKKKRNH